MSKYDDLNFICSGICSSLFPCFHFVMNIETANVDQIYFCFYQISISLKYLALSWPPKGVISQEKQTDNLRNSRSKKVTYF